MLIQNLWIYADTSFARIYTFYSALLSSLIESYNDTVAELLLLQGYPLLLQQGRTRVVIRNYVIRGGVAGPHGSGSYLTGPTAPDPLPALGWVR